MGRTACTEPQCLYKGALYLYLVVLTTNDNFWVVPLFHSVSAMELWWKPRASVSEIFRTIISCHHLCGYNSCVIHPTGVQYVPQAEFWRTWMLPCEVMSLYKFKWFRACRMHIHLAVCLTTVPKPLPKRVLHIVRSRASSFK